MLVAPLNWGLGHAARCIPIINALIKAGFIPIIASDGNALKLLQKEFPKLKSFELPSYHISYSRNSKFFKLKLLSVLPKVLKAVKDEKRIVAKIIQKEKVSGLISDNRFGVRNSLVPSVYITHQINVLSGITTWFTSKFHKKIINKFDECWIPDTEKNSLSGILSVPKNLKIPFKYLGIMSRFQHKITEIKYEIAVVLSGIEPQRTMLEIELLKQFESYSGRVLFIRGVLDSEEIENSKKNLIIKNYLLSNELELALNQSNIVLVRSGYSTIMDMATLGKKVFFLPTPGQNEQEYLAAFLQNKKVSPYSKQQDFKIESLAKMENYTGFKKHKSVIDLDVFSLF